MRRSASILSTMLRLLKLLVLTGVISAASMSWAKSIEVSALIVAYSTLPACMNGNAYWSLLLHVEAPNELRGRFVQVNFSQPCGVSPKMLGANSKIQRYRLIRDKERDAVLEEFISCDDISAKDGALKPCQKIPAWKRLPGTENEALPFATKVPAYLDADLPNVPLL